MMIRLPAIASLLVFATAPLILGCSPTDEPPQVVVPADGIESIPPLQVQTALGQLTATTAREQQSGLAFVQKFPSLATTHRELIEQLADEGATSAIQQRASQLLKDLPEAP